MDRGKPSRRELEEEWLLVARAENHDCPVCDRTIIHGDRDVHSRTGLCGHCSRQRESEDDRR